MPRKSKTQQESGFMRSFWDECVTLQEEYVASVGLYAYPTKRPGVWRFKLVFTPMMNDLENVLGDHSLSFDYPAAENRTLSGALWDSSMKLVDMIDEGGLKSALRRKSSG